MSLLALRAPSAAAGATGAAVAASASIEDDSDGYDAAGGIVVSQSRRRGGSSTGGRRMSSSTSSVELTSSPHAASPSAGSAGDGSGAPAVNGYAHSSREDRVFNWRGWQQEEPPGFPGAGTLFSAAASLSSTIDVDLETDVVAAEDGDPSLLLPACVICQDDVPADRRGFLPACAHIFHIDCITQWALITNTCPMCKVRFDRVARLQPCGEVVGVPDGVEGGAAVDGSAFSQPMAQSSAAIAAPHAPSTLELLSRPAAAAASSSLPLPTLEPRRLSMGRHVFSQPPPAAEVNHSSGGVGFSAPGDAVAAFPAGPPLLLRVVEELIIPFQAQTFVATADDLEAFGYTAEELESLCSRCGNGENEEDLLLCDGHCGTATHTFCLGLSSVPHSDWWCATCVSEGAAPEDYRPLQPRQRLIRPRRQQRSLVVGTSEGEGDTSSSDDDHEVTEPVGHARGERGRGRPPSLSVHGDTYGSRQLRSLVQAAGSALLPRTAPSAGGDNRRSSRHSSSSAAGGRGGMMAVSAAPLGASSAPASFAAATAREQVVGEKRGRGRPPRGSASALISSQPQQQRQRDGQHNRPRAADDEDGGDAGAGTRRYPQRERGFARTRTQAGIDITLHMAAVAVAQGVGSIRKSAPRDLRVRGGTTAASATVSHRSPRRDAADGGESADRGGRGARLRAPLAAASTTLHSTDSDGDVGDAGFESDDLDGTAAASVAPSAAQVQRRSSLLGLSRAAVPVPSVAGGTRIRESGGGGGGGDTRPSATTVTTSIPADLDRKDEVGNPSVAPSPSQPIAEEDADDDDGGDVDSDAARAAPRSNSSAGGLGASAASTPTPHARPLHPHQQHYQAGGSSGNITARKLALHTLLRATGSGGSSGPRSGAVGSPSEMPPLPSQQRDRLSAALQSRGVAARTTPIGVSGGPGYYGGGLLGPGGMPILSTTSSSGSSATSSSGGTGSHLFVTRCFNDGVRDYSAAAATSTTSSSSSAVASSSSQSLAPLALSHAFSSGAGARFSTGALLSPQVWVAPPLASSSLLNRGVKQGGQSGSSASSSAAAPPAAAASSVASASAAGAARGSVPSSSPPSALWTFLNSTGMAPTLLPPQQQVLLNGVSPGQSPSSALAASASIVTEPRYDTSNSSGGAAATAPVDTARHRPPPAATAGTARGGDVGGIYSSTSAPLPSPQRPAAADKAWLSSSHALPVIASLRDVLHGEEGGVVTSTSTSSGEHALQRRRHHGERRGANEQRDTAASGSRSAVEGSAAGSARLSVFGVGGGGSSSSENAIASSAGTGESRLGGEGGGSSSGQSRVEARAIVSSLSTLLRSRRGTHPAEPSLSHDDVKALAQAVHRELARKLPRDTLLAPGGAVGGGDTEKRQLSAVAQAALEKYVVRHLGGRRY